MSEMYEKFQQILLGVNLHSTVAWMLKELLSRNRCDTLSLSGSNCIRTYNPLVRKRTLNHLTKLAKCLSVRLRTKCLWVRIPLLSLMLLIDVTYKLIDLRIPVYLPFVIDKAWSMIDDMKPLIESAVHIFKKNSTCGKRNIRKYFRERL